jgi:hypothetical protein
MAFIRTSGINPLREALKRHCDSGGALRVLTTTSPCVRLVVASVFLRMIRIGETQHD